MAELIVALDYQEKKQALNFAQVIQNDVKWVKIGLELFISAGPDVLYELKKMGFKVFVDLKLHDIPNTIVGSVKSLVKHGADMITLHLVGGQRMICEAVEEAHKADIRPLLMGVTVLTSIDKGELIAYNGEISSLVQTLAKCAESWNLDGIISSGQELENIRSLIPSLKIVCPGIRLDDAKSDDQRRVMTPQKATKLGADYLVVGRPITQAKNANEIVKQILEQIK